MYRTVIKILSVHDHGTSWLHNIIWNGVVICACVLCNIMAYYIHSKQKYTLKKWRLDEVIIFLNCGILHCAPENGADLCVNESQ